VSGNFRGKAVSFECSLTTQSDHINYTLNSYTVQALVGALAPFMDPEGARHRDPDYNFGSCFAYVCVDSRNTGHFQEHRPAIRQNPRSSALPL